MELTGVITPVYALVGLMSQERNLTGHISGARTLVGIMDSGVIEIETTSMEWEILE